MISAWDIYWVMQLDTLIGMFVGVAMACVYVVFLAGLFTDGEALGIDSDRPASWLKWPAVIFVAAGLCAAFLPSTKTAAAMIVIPRIANNEAIQHEAGDLYGIAKDALRTLAAPKQEAK